jgi:hypothetical protein
VVISCRIFILDDDIIIFRIHNGSHNYESVQTICKL